MASATRGIRALLLLCACAVIVQPAYAQIDLWGEWANPLHEDQAYRGPGPEIGEYEGFPINEAARKKAESWDASVYTLPERQCIPFSADHGLTIGAVRITKDVDPVSQEIIAWREHHEWQAQTRTIWMDRRPHPPEWAPHTWQGFSTGEWIGQTLKVTTTHLKMAFIDRNGVPRSDKATLTEFYVRHGDFLTIVQIIDDPVYLTESFVRDRTLVFNPVGRMGGYSCRPAAEIVNRERGYVPHHLPGTNPFLDAATKRYGVPPAATRGGAETMYPEFAVRSKADPGRPRVPEAR